jgi:hypothetical protein
MSIDDATPQDWNKAAANTRSTNDSYIDPYDQPMATAYKDFIDDVDQPSHYTYGQIECIDYLEDNLKIGFEYFLEGNVKKYLHRFRHKGSELKDLRKARWYLDKLISTIDSEDK